MTFGITVRIGDLEVNVSADDVHPEVVETLARIARTELLALFEAMPDPVVEGD